MCYDLIRGDMKYSSVVSSRDGVPLKRHWFDKPNKCWWGLIINGGIDDSVWWPWALSYWMGSVWIMNEEFPDWSARLSLQTLSWHSNGAWRTRSNAPTTQLSQASCRTWSHHSFATWWRARCESMSSTQGETEEKGFLNIWLSRDSWINGVSKYERQEADVLQDLKEWDNSRALSEFVLEYKMSGLCVWYQTYTNPHWHKVGRVH